jgi:hypothetical protein
MKTFWRQWTRVQALGGQNWVKSHIWLTTTFQKSAVDFKFLWHFLYVCMDMNSQWVTLIKGSSVLLPDVRYWSQEFLRRTPTYLQGNHSGKPICDLKYKPREIDSEIKALFWAYQGILLCTQIPVGMVEVTVGNNVLIRCPFIYDSQDSICSDQEQNDEPK